MGKLKEQFKLTNSSGYFIESVDGERCYMTTFSSEAMVFTPEEFEAMPLSYKDDFQKVPADPRRHLNF